MSMMSWTNEHNLGVSWWQRAQQEKLAVEYNQNVDCGRDARTYYWVYHLVDASRVIYLFLDQSVQSRILIDQSSSKIIQ